MPHSRSRGADFNFGVHGSDLGNQVEGMRCSLLSAVACTRAFSKKSPVVDFHALRPSSSFQNERGAVWMLSSELPFQPIEGHQGGALQDLQPGGQSSTVSTHTPGGPMAIDTIDSSSNAVSKGTEPVGERWYGTYGV